MKRLNTFACALLVVLTGCSEPTTDIEITTTDIDTSLSGSLTEPEQIDRVIDPSPVSAAFQSAAQTAMSETLEKCLIMQQQVFNFVVSPNEQTQTEAQLSFDPCHQSWSASALYFTEPFNLNEAEGLQKLVDLIDTRPYLAGYIDGIPTYPYSGLIHELELVITVETLRGQHRLMDEESASLGFPVIEFFLWKGPLQDHWQDQSDEEQQNLVNRRLTYLKVATEQLITQLEKAQFRWSDNGEFSQLPDRAKFNLALKSLQRFTMAELLNHIFSDTALEEPELTHPAQFAGNGRAYLIKQLAQLTILLGNVNQATPLSEWLDEAEIPDVSPQEMQQALAEAITAISNLPENFPFDAATDAQWDAARLQIAKLALGFTNLSQQLNITIVTQ